MLRSVKVLFGLDARRARGFLRYPSVGAAAGVVLPAALAVALLWSIGRASRPVLADADGALLLSMLVAGPLSYLAYGTLFRSGDGSLLRRLGIDSRAIYVERSARHLAECAGAGILALVPFAAAGSALAPAATVAAGSALGAWGAGLAATALAARSLARHSPGRGWGCLMAGIMDREVAAAAPLAYAPLPGFIAGTATGAAAYASGWWLAWAAAFSGLAAVAGARWYAQAVPRFGPQALEMAYVPNRSGRLARLSVGRGVARLLPRRVAAAWARDAAIVSRRFPWAARVAWPVAIGGFLGLARWGDAPATRGWVVTATLLALLVQGLAGVGLGRVEARGRRWVDRSIGIGTAPRMAGRWAWGWGLSIWMTIPVALAWTWWSGAEGGWRWVLAGGAVAGVSAAASSLIAGWR